MCLVRCLSRLAGRPSHKCETPIPILTGTVHADSFARACDGYRIQARPHELHPVDISIEKVLEFITSTALMFLKSLISGTVHLHAT